MQHNGKLVTKIKLTESGIARVTKCSVFYLIFLCIVGLFQ